MSEIEKLRTKAEKLSSLLDASSDLNMLVGIEKVLGRILMQMIKVTESEAGTLWLLDEERQLIQAKVAEGPSSEAMNDIELKSGEGIVGKVILTGKPHLVEDARNDPKWAMWVDDHSGFVTRSMMSIPLMVKEGAIGALQLLNKTKGRMFDQEDLQLALSLSQHSELALHNSGLYDDQYRMSMSMIRTLTKTIDARDPYTSGHSERVAQYSLRIAEKLGWSEEECKQLERDALLHDIGKIGIPDYILAKPGKLSEDEFRTMMKHPEIGAEILADMEPKKAMKQAVLVAKHHHERLDGSGYPDGLKDEQIPVSVRIVAVADSFDAMTTERPYSKGRSINEGIQELIRCKGKLFDEKVVDALMSVIGEKPLSPLGARQNGLI